MVGVARRMLRRQDLAEEAVQDTFMRVWRAARTFDPQQGRGPHAGSTPSCAIARSASCATRAGSARTKTRPKTPSPDDRERARATAGDQRTAALPGAARRLAPRGGGAGLCAWAVARRTRRQARRAARHREELGAPQPDLIAGVHGMTPEPDDRAVAGEYVLGLLEGEAKAAAERRLVDRRGVRARGRGTGRCAFSEFDDTADAAARRARRCGIGSRQASRAPPPRGTAAPSAWARLWGDLAALRATALGASLAALLLAVGPRLRDPRRAAAADHGGGAARRRQARRGGAGVRRRPRRAGAAHHDRRAGRPSASRCGPCRAASAARCRSD